MKPPSQIDQLSQFGEVTSSDGLVTVIPPAGNLAGNDDNGNPVVTHGGVEYRLARVPRGWYERRRWGEWQIVPPGSLTLPERVKRNLENDQ